MRGAVAVNGNDQSEKRDALRNKTGGKESNSCCQHQGGKTDKNERWIKKREKERRWMDRNGGWMYRKDTKTEKESERDG